MKTKTITVHIPARTVKLTGTREVEMTMLTGGIRQWTALQFRAWMRRHGYTIPRLASALDISHRQISYYRSGEREIPRVVALALNSLIAR